MASMKTDSSVKESQFELSVLGTHSQQGTTWHTKTGESAVWFMFRLE